MPRQKPIGFDHTQVIAAPQSRVVAAFFVPVALTNWWGVARSVTTPRALGAYALEWEDSQTHDEILGPLGGVLHGTVMDFHPRRGFLIADLYWLPPRGEPVGPMAIDVTCTIREKRPPLPGTPGVDRSARQLPSSRAERAAPDRADRLRGERSVEALLRDPRRRLARRP